MSFWGVSRLSSQTTEAGKAAAAAAAGGAAADGTGATADPAAPNQDASKAAANIGPVVYKPITKHELSLEQQLYYQSVTQGMLEPNNAEYCEVGPCPCAELPALPKPHHLRLRPSAPRCLPMMGRSRAGVFRLPLAHIP